MCVCVCVDALVFQILRAKRQTYRRREKAKERHRECEMNDDSKLKHQCVQNINTAIVLCAELLRLFCWLPPTLFYRKTKTIYLFRRRQTHTVTHTNTDDTPKLPNLVEVKFVWHQNYYRNIFVCYISNDFVSIYFFEFDFVDGSFFFSCSVFTNSSIFFGIHLLLSIRFFSWFLVQLGVFVCQWNKHAQIDSEEIYVSNTITSMTGRKYVDTGEQSDWNIIEEIPF